MSRPSPRRPASSRGVTPRPRKIAGQSPVPPPSQGTPPKLDLRKPKPPREPDPAREPHHPPAWLASARVTKVLIAVLAALALVLVVLGGIAGWQAFHGDSDSTVATDAGGAGSAVVVPSGRPVVASTLAVQDGVDAAAKAAEELFSVDYSKYDDELTRAVALMTPRYEADYRKTIAKVKDQAVALQLVVQSNVVAQGVVRANRTRLQALIFLNQVTHRVRDKKPETVVTPFKALVTMVHTDKGWLVDGLETDEPTRDKNN
ncbi:MAG TPA: hypothetical protein VNS81_02945 [Nocardioides sp.]|nr:hypothetical protein [Nocardioides sp.]